ncbi:HAD family hydrolase [Agrobacterium sp. SOY23]|uniref:HAD family hydrolase n=1 Tax=Agrobacterium sp. SOY23 TaxID=3014555 RepID=UPI0022AF8A87|nr:HAD family hydrolase [Agrobacterium sp. SOY23]MCZ4433116.1 HAD family hydrolase [Agrobacterium sp. SOY23]
MKLVLFDCDGTLVDSAGLIHAVMSDTFAYFGKPRPDIAQTKAIIGLTLDIAIARMLGKTHVDDEAQAMTQRYREVYHPIRERPEMTTPLFDGIAALIDTLSKRDDVLIGAVTGKGRRGLTQILESHGFAEHFIVSRTADDCPSKPHPAMVMECCHETGMVPADTIVIGDAIYDMQMAKAAGAKAIGVAWGYASVDELWKAGADAVVSHPREIPAYVPADTSE